ncbi:MAG TPA: sn-glycerol-3-phosphate ABC transporter ATP-binding protein UgpC [Opitutus sp.]|nr:sn-glycerol-3-phosphate ABC transporter ATP-binding protein UgpC [Opitutus sp.]
MSRVVLENLCKTYPDKKGAAVPAVDRVSLEIRDREFMVLVGPSGCGKSTSLRMIAGLEEITGGTISIDGRVVNDVPPKDRDIAMVFQNYALYPHMTVYENMAFGLKLRRFPKPEIDARVREAAAMLGLEALLDRKPKALSGGQRQRVAVGRAIVRKPKVFLFDEPLSNLDAKMRVSMRTEIAKLHARLEATMIYVTHDQVEAMTMGDRICVMKDGCIQQVAAPIELYDRPANRFVAGFIGSPSMNFFNGVLRRSDGRFEFVEDNANAEPVRIALPVEWGERAAAHADARIVLGVRPENVHEASAGSGTAVRVEVVEPMGAETLLHLNSGATTFVARLPPARRFETGRRLDITVDSTRLHFFDPVTGAAI